MTLLFPRISSCVLAGIFIVCCVPVLPPLAAAQAVAPQMLASVETQGGAHSRPEMIADGNLPDANLSNANPASANPASANPASANLSSADLPDAPEPQQTPAPTPSAIQPPPPSQQPSAPATPSTPASPDSSSSSTQTPADGTPAKPDGTAQKPTPPEKSRYEVAEEQLKQEKKQRVFGFLPSFNTSYIDSAVSLTPKQKLKLAFSQTTDPVQFGIAAFAAGLDEADGGGDGYGGGPLGYGKRWGADYLDSFDGNMLGNAIFPIILHQDPRFFRRGYGSATRRIFYAISTSFICKHDVTGKWEPNYSNIAGNLAGGAISNFYVPQQERGVTNIFSGAALVTIEGGAGAILQEFWPDISRHFFHKDPTNGQDAANQTLKK